MIEFDDAESRRVEAAYRTADVVEQRRLMLEALRLAPGESVLDVGSGPGLLAAEMAAALGPMGAVHGLEPSESMRALARARELADDAAPMAFVSGDAAALPFEDASFDVVVSTQVYEYVADLPPALTEAHRVLRRRAAWPCSTPTGPRSCGAPATTLACAACSWPGTSTWPTRTCPSP